MPGHMSGLVQLWLVIFPGSSHICSMHVNMDVLIYYSDYRVALVQNIKYNNITPIMKSNGFLETDTFPFSKLCFYVNGWNLEGLGLAHAVPQKSILGPISFIILLFTWSTFKCQWCSPIYCLADYANITVSASWTMWTCVQCFKYCTNVHKQWH